MNDVLCEAGVSSGGRLNNRAVTGEGLTVLRNSVGANKRSRNRIQQQISEVGFVTLVNKLLQHCSLITQVLRCHVTLFQLRVFCRLQCVCVGC